MALALALLFRARLRLLPLLIALAAAGADVRRAGAARAPLTMASIAVLPVLIGLAVDYAIQSSPEARAGREGAAVARAARACRRSPRPRWPPASASSSCCSRRCRWCGASGRCWWPASRSPWACALTAGTAVLTLAARRRRVRAASVARSLRGAGELVDGARGAARACARRARPARDQRARLTLRAGRHACSASRWRWPCSAGRLETQHSRRLRPATARAAEPAGAARPATLQHDTGVAGEVDVLVQARDLADPKVVAWMSNYQNGVLQALRLLGGARLRTRATLCPALSLPDLFRTPRAPRHARRRSSGRCSTPCRPTSRRRRSRRDRRTAALAFGIRLHAAGPPAAGDRRHARAAAPAAGRDARSSPACRCWRRRPTRSPSPWRRLATLLVGLLAVVARALRSSTARGSAPGCRSCRSRWPPAGRRSCCGCSGCR